ncbi:hypothetical protein [Leptospira alexanderi]|uniref:hypothetical protein n=1 Tax=Leptospira alexanderi TaxID=100053 RepID=UPI00030E8AC6|nr:hypothetical protein [Leptospira alexanderi]
MEEFCRKYEDLFNFKLEKSNLSEQTMQSLVKLFDRVVWYSPFLEERKKISGYLNEKEIIESILQCRNELGSDQSRSKTMVDYRVEYLCPVCGFELDFLPWEGLNPSFGICPCCGIQFGYTDATPEGEGKEQQARYRKWWISQGMPWQDYGVTDPPPNWDPKEQLKRIGIFL